MLNYILILFRIRIPPDIRFMEFKNVRLDVGRRLEFVKVCRDDVLSVRPVRKIVPGFLKLRPVKS